MSWSRKIVTLWILVSVSSTVYSAGFTIELFDGKFYGPGNMGEHDIKNGTLENFIVTAPMSGHIPFFNNGEEEPNTDAETLHSGPVDGMLSDGTKINENVNAAFVLEIEEPETKELVKLLVCSVSEELVSTDEKDNLTFNLHAAFDTGFAQDAIQLPIQFFTGAVTVPVSEKNKRGLEGGNDNAGPYPAGSVYVGRVGDMDQDGFMDGIFTLAGNTPFELLIAEGDPVLIIRPFKSDIPINPKHAAYYELNGVVKNLKDQIQTALLDQQYDISISFINDSIKRLDAVTKNIGNIKVKMSQNNQDNSWGTSIKNNIDESNSMLMSSIEKLKINESESSVVIVDDAFLKLENALIDMANILSKN